MNFKEKIKAKIKSSEKLSVPAIYRTRILSGYEVYKKLISDQSEDTVVYLCPYSGSGDVYLASMYMRAYAKENKHEHFLAAVIGKANYKVALLFGFENIKIISQDDADKLMRFCIFLGDKNEQIKVMHHDPPQAYCGILENMRNFNGLNFTDLYVYNVFQLNMKKDRQMPAFDFNSPETDELIGRNKLPPGNTVIISPYVNTLPSLPWWVWVNLAEKLKQRGYVVCTNCGTPDEPPINGTIPLSFEFDISVPLIEKCGYFIGIRSGFCDIISSAKAKKIIIYQPYLFWGAGTNFDYFSLNKIGFCNDAIEMEYEGVEFLDLIDKIIGAMD